MYALDYTHFASKPTGGIVDASVEVNKDLQLAAGCVRVARIRQRMRCQHVLLHMSSAGHAVVIGAARDGIRAPAGNAKLTAESVIRSAGTTWATS